MALPESLRGRMCMDAAHGDVDADGDLDLVLAIEFGLPALLRNDGAGRFEFDRDAIPAGDGDNEEALLFDADGDGDLDLFTAHEDDGVHALLINDGTGQFTDASDRVSERSVANGADVLDVDDDGRPDIALGNRGVNLILLQQADGRFLSAGAPRLPGTLTTQDLFPADIDGDGDTDLIVANEGRNQVLIRMTDGYTDESELRLPEDPRESREIDGADIDGDGDIDLIVGNVAFIGDGDVSNRLWQNDGRGYFTDITDVSLGNVANDGRSFTVHFVDIDRDGDPDILSPQNRIGRGGSLSVWLNDGAGQFTEDTTPFDTPVAGSVFDIELFDANGDGLDDLYFCHRSGPDQLFEAWRE